MHEDLLALKKWSFFFIVTAFQLMILFSIKYFFLTQSIFLNTYADQFTFDRINEVFKSQIRNQWIGYLLLPFILAIKKFYNSICLSAGTLLNSERSYFKVNFNICLKAEYIFVAMLLVKLAAFAFYKEVETLNDLGFIPFSLANIFNISELPKWAIYPLQTVNIWEALFCWVGTSLYAIQFNVSKEKAAALFCIPYLTGLFIWILVVVFLTMQFT